MSICRVDTPFISARYSVVAKVEQRMTIDWDFAVQVGGIGFGIVFGVLILLSILTWLIGRVINRIEAGQEETGDKQKGA